MTHYREEIKRTRQEIRRLALQVDTAANAKIIVDRVDYLVKLFRAEESEK